MVELFESYLNDCVKSGVLNFDDREVVFLAANHLVVQGQSWAFRKWAFKNHLPLKNI